MAFIILRTESRGESELFFVFVSTEVTTLGVKVSDIHYHPSLDILLIFLGLFWGFFLPGGGG